MNNSKITSYENEITISLNSHVLRELSKHTLYLTAHIMTSKGLFYQRVTIPACTLSRSDLYRFIDYYCHAILKNCTYTFTSKKSHKKFNNTFNYALENICNVEPLSVMFTFNSEFDPEINFSPFISNCYILNNYIYKNN